jgi:hypothetical protein
MITKERLEETIRQVIQEFKQANRIAEPAANELTVALEARVETLFEQEGTFSYRAIDDSATYVEQLRDEAQLKSAEVFLREITEWQQVHS